MKAIPGFLALAFMVLSVQADTLQLRDGRVINGTYEGGDRAGIQFLPYGETQASVFDLGSVANITLQANSAASTYSSTYSTQTWNSNNHEVAPVASPLPAVSTTMPVATGAYTGPTYSSTDIQSPDNRLIPAGAVIAVRTVDPIDCNRSQVGTTWQATLAAPIVLDGQLIAPAGSAATVQVMGSEHGDVSLQLVSFTNINGRTISVASSDGVNADLNDQTVRARHIVVGPQTLLSFTLQQNVRV